MLQGRMPRKRTECAPDTVRGTRGDVYREPQLSHSLELVERLKRVAERHGVTPGAVAVAWTLRHPAVDGAIAGFRRPDQIEPIVAAAELELSHDDVAEIEG